MTGPRNADALSDIAERQDRLDDLLDEMEGLAKTLLELGREREDGLQEMHRPILLQAGLRIERNLRAARELIKELAAAAKGGPS